MINIDEGSYAHGVAPRDYTMPEFLRKRFEGYRWACTIHKTYYKSMRECKKHLLKNEHCFMIYTEDRPKEQVTLDTINRDIRVGNIFRMWMYKNQKAKL